MPVSRGPVGDSAQGGSRGQESKKRGAWRFPEDFPDIGEADGRRPSRVGAQAKHAAESDVQAQRGAEDDVQAKQGAEGDVQAKHIAQASPGRETQHGESAERSAEGCSEENPERRRQIARRPEHREKAGSALETLCGSLRPGGGPLVGRVTLRGCGHGGKFRVLMEGRWSRRGRRRGRDGNRSRRGGRRAGVRS
jgi:hypothetical protein